MSGIAASRRSIRPAGNFARQDGQLHVRSIDATRWAARSPAVGRAAAALTIGDLSVLLDAFHNDLRSKTAVRVRHERLMDAVLSCRNASAAQLPALARDVEKTTGLGGEPGRQVADAARKLAAKGKSSGSAGG